MDLTRTLISISTNDADRAARKHSMNDSNATAERVRARKQLESGDEPCQANSHSVSIDGQKNASQRFDMRQPELLSLITTGDDKTCEPGELHRYE